MGWWRSLVDRIGRGHRARGPIEVVIFTRTGCHLCADAEVLLRRMCDEYRLDLHRIDIDKDPELVGRYGEKVPVVRIAGRDRLFGCINPVLLRRALRAARG